MYRLLPRALLSVLFFLFPAALMPSQTPHTLTYALGKRITLSLPDSFDINIAATGLKRVRFFAKSPDGRIFTTTMHDLNDNHLSGEPPHSLYNLTSLERFQLRPRSVVPNQAGMRMDWE